MQAVQQRWEYATESHHDLAAFEQTLARRGREGWELVDVVGHFSDRGNEPVKTLRGKKTSHWIGFFKRPAD